MTQLPPFETGIHHVTSITANVQANVDFYAGFLGLKLVKQTGGYEDGEQLHLFYGDALGNPGTLVSFLVWEAAGRGRTGIGQVSELSFAVAPDSIGQWLTRAIDAKITVEGPSREFGETVLRMKDPDGLIVKLVGVDMPTPTPIKDAPTRIRGVTFLVKEGDATIEFLNRFGYKVEKTEDTLTRMVSQSDVVDVRVVGGFVDSITGAGVPDHVAFRARDLDAVRQMRLDLKDYGPTSVHDRQYFMSLYVRDPSDVLIEYATDAPGMTVDEAAEDLGKNLVFAPHDQYRATELRLRLPQFVLPHEPRLRLRDLPFIHRFHCPDEEDGSTFILFHGTGGNEADLMPIAHKINPKALILGLRGRSTEEGSNRWFRREGLDHFDQSDIRAEAAALNAFLEEAIRAYGLERDKITLLGYSNGANFIGAFLRLYPQNAARAVLLRPIDVLDADAPTQAKALPVLIVTGKLDHTAGPNAKALAPALSAAGYQVTSHDLPQGHDLRDEDAKLAQDWLATLKG